MNLMKIALTGAAALGLVVSGTAQAASTRAAASLPAASKVKKLSRTSAPASLEAASSLNGAGTPLLIAALLGGGAGLYIALKGDDSPGS